MKRIGLLLQIILLLGITSGLYSQVDTENKKVQKQMAREETKKVRKAEESKYFENIKSLVLSGRFVIENEFQSELNYVMIDSLSSTIQTGQRYSSTVHPSKYTDFNGLGKTTISGVVHNYTVKEINRRKSFIVKYDIYEMLGSSSVTIRISASGFASVTVVDNSNNPDPYPFRFQYIRNQPSITGNLVSLDECNIFRGPRELYL